MFSKHSQRDSKITEVEIEEALPAVSSEENFFHSELRLDYGHYEPILDPESEFPWHHPDAQIPDVEYHVPEIDTTQFHDPWDIYRGHIPPIIEDTSHHQSDSQKVENHEEMRKYAWDYMSPQHHQEETRSDVQNIWQPENYQQHPLQHSDHTHHDFRDNVWEYNAQYDNSQDQQHSNTFYEQPTNFDHYHQDHSINNNTNTITQHEDSSDNLKHYTEHQHYGYYGCTDQSQQENQTYNNHDSNKEFHKHTILNQHHEPISEYSFYKDSEKAYYPAHTQRSRVEHVYYVHRDHEKARSHQQDNIQNNQTETEPKVNGICEEDDEIFEDLRPRHPYDGFYLRHRMTIDSRGKKICTHEVPPTPTPSPPESPLPMENSLQLLNDEVVEQSINTEDQVSSSFKDVAETGVAGNLSRVVLGAGAQREALDDLTRRQGWEAGNIDYMGADAFDNIWAKISQTLSQPRASSPKQSTPPPQPAPAPAPEPSAPVEEAPKIVENSAITASVEKPVEAPAPAAPVVADKPAAVEASAPLKAPVPEEAPAAAEVAVPIEAKSPVPAEAPAQIKATAPVKPSEPAVEKAPVPAAPVKAPAKVVAAAIPPEPRQGTPPESPVVEIPAPACLVKTSETIPSESSADQKKPESAAISPNVESAPAKEPITIPSKPEVTPEKGASMTDSPPLANTPSKEEVPIVSAAKSEERRKPAGKLQLHPPAAADPLPTPDSELEDAATLAHAIIAGELRSPTVTSPSSPAAPASPRAPLQEQRLSVEEPELPTPPVGAVSLSQIGVKPQPKATTAARIESSVSEAADAPRKKVVKKVLKKEGAAGDAPVPPPRKKEKKPKDK